MDETIIIPSPNWFHVSIMGASQDGWLVYGGPAKSLCFLEPLNSIGTLDSKQRFKAHIFHRAHKDKISSVSISPEWPEKRNVLTGGHDGVIKEWTIESKGSSWSINYLHCNEEHSVYTEEVAGVCYGTATVAVSVGSVGNILKWDLNTNIVKRYYTHLRNFKPTCISASPHKQLQVAVGTRQGVIFVIDINGTGAGKLIYKVRGQDDEINQVSWCPQFAVAIHKPAAKEKHKKKQSASTRMDRIRNDLEPSEALEAAIAEVGSTEDNTKQPEEEEEVIIPEDDMFDVYKDHEANEFGHKKYEPEDIYVKVKEEKQDDFLVECEKLKAEILKNKNAPEESIESLVEALDNAHVEDTPGDEDTGQEPTQATQESESLTTDNNEYKHLLASIGKYGGIRIWSQTGKLLSTCNVLFNKKDDKDYKSRGPNWPTLHWFKPDTLLIADGKNQLLQANPLVIDSKNKVQWQVVHALHRRGLYCVLSNAPRVQTAELLADPSAKDWVAWTVGQDRNIISYNIAEKKQIQILTSSGGFIYEVKSCAYDAGKIAISAGDGSVRVWQTHTTNDLEDQLAAGLITSYWQNVQGKILTVAWHPTKENLLAFATAESRIGLLDAGGSCEKPAKNFPNSFKQGVYSLSWGQGMNLYACGNGELALFRANKIDEKGRHIPVEIEGQVWQISEAQWTPHGLIVGAFNGGVALLDDKDYHVITATFVFQKIIYTITCHPQQTSNSDEESKYKNYIALCSLDKSNAIAILEYEDKGESAKQFNKILEPLSGHESSVLEVAWNPHRDAQLLSASQDATIRIWNVLERECIAIFGGHSVTALSGMWCPQPRLADKVLSGGGDCCLRLWDLRDHPPASFAGVIKEPPKKKNKYRAKEDKKKEIKRGNEENAVKTEDPIQSENNKKPVQTEEQEARPSTSLNAATIAVDQKTRATKSKIFLLPLTAMQTNKRSMSSVRRFLTKYIEEHESIDLADVLRVTASREKDLGFLRLFGTMNELNELLDEEAKHHLENNCLESYLMLLFYRGRVDEMIQFALENDVLDPYLLSLTPSVSFKFWKDSTQLYITQLERMAAKGLTSKSFAFNYYGGIIIRTATALLSMHNMKGCIQFLMDSTMFKEAYVICRLRHMDSIAEEVLETWAKSSFSGGLLMMSAILQLLRGEISEASIALGRSSQINYLKLAAQLAKLAGHNTFATHISTRVVTKERQKAEKAETEEELGMLPSRIQALLDAGDCSDSEEGSDEECIVGMAVNGNGVTKLSDPAASLNVAVSVNGNENVSVDGVGLSVEVKGAKESEE